MSETKPEPASLATPTWRLFVRGVEVRLRFLMLLGLLGLVMVGWPWLRAGWDRIATAWRPHHPQSSVSGDTEFFCPMDPGVVSAWPAICPVCNMDLITRKKSDAVLLPEGVVARMQFSPYRVQLAGIRVAAIEEAVGTGREPAGQGKVLMVPATAVVHQGDSPVVFVETMPGMFDGIPVQLGARDGDRYTVKAGLKSGQRVVVAGAFLIDAESRLHSNMATQYFGAGTGTRMPEPPRRRSQSGKSAEPLSQADLAAAEQQAICPVTDAPLGSMGTPVFTLVGGRKVFLCCRGCESGLLADPETYLAKLKPVVRDKVRP